MIKKPWTPDNCPVQAGMVIHDVRTNVDILVAKRYLNYDGNNTDEDKPLIELANGDRFTGRDLFDGPYTYYPKWHSTAEERACYNEVKEPESDIIKLAQCVFEGLKESKYAVKDLHYKEDGKGGFIWEDDIHNKVSGIITELANVFEEFKHDEQQ